MDPRLSIVAAVAENGVIGRGGELPWRLPTDLQHFRELTRGHTVIVGRKTHESIVRRLGRTLPERLTVVLTHNPNYIAEGCVVVRTLDEARDLLADNERGFVIGGAEVYRLTLPLTTMLYLTRVHANVEGDTFFPEVVWTAWEQVSEEDVRQDPKDELPFTFEVWERRVQ